MRFVSLRMSMGTVVSHLKTVSNPQKNLHNFSKVCEDDLSLESYMDIGYIQPIKTSSRFFEGSIDALKG